MFLKIAMLAGTIALCTIVGQNGKSGETPFFCNLKALNGAERSEHLKLTVRLGEAVLKMVEVTDGYVFEIDDSRLSFKDLATWTAFERRCCPFFDFSLALGRENGPMTLRLTGRDGVKDFIRAEFQKSSR